MSYIEPNLSDVLLFEYTEPLKKSCELRNEEIINFRKLNSDNLLLDQTKYQKNENPDISVIVLSSSSKFTFLWKSAFISKHSLDIVKIV